MSGVLIWRYRRNFRLGAMRGTVIVRARTSGLASQLLLDGRLMAEDATPAFGPDAVRNHLLGATLPDGSVLAVEAGYISAINVGIAVRRDGVLIHESHPGRTIAYPDEYRDMTEASEATSLIGAIKEGFREGAAGANASPFGDIDVSVFKRNAVPLAVDIALGLLFYIVAKQFDLTTAALVGAGAGLVLLVVQRITRIDLLGGLALFGIMLLILSATLAILFQSDEAVKYRSSVVGLVSAGLFLIDGLFGGNRLAARLLRYLPYRGMDAARLGIGMGVMGLVMAGLNVAVAQWASTDGWLFYTTFADVFVGMGLCLMVFQYAQGKLLRAARPAYRPFEAEGHRA